MRVAFYAPLKPPDHPVPSGDRRIARLFLAALRQAGQQPFIASRLRSFDGGGDTEYQRRVAREGQRRAERLIRQWRQRPDIAPELWFTYHLYYKAPDWLGPAISDALAIPYIVAEASHAGKRAAGPWAIGHRAVERALRRADAVIGLNSADRDGVLPLLRDPGRWLALRPFLDAGIYAAALPRQARAPRLIAVAMMRPGDKLASYRLLGRALSQLLDLPWTIDIVGDGPARSAVEAALASCGARLLYRGALGEAGIAAALAEADLFVWPAINEAFGMAVLEAQASGVPVVVGRSGGVADIVAPGFTGVLTPPGDIAAFAAAARRLILDPGARIEMSVAAALKVAREHDLPSAALRLGGLINALARQRAA